MPVLTNLRCGFPWTLYQGCVLQSNEAFHHNSIAKERKEKKWRIPLQLRDCSNAKEVGLILVRIRISKYFLSYQTSENYTIQSKLSSKNVIYLVSCKKWRLQYFRFTSTTMVTNEEGTDVLLRTHTTFCFQCIYQLQPFSNSDMKPTGALSYLLLWMKDRNFTWTIELITASVVSFNKIITLQLSSHSDVCEGLGAFNL